MKAQSGDWETGDQFGDSKARYLLTRERASGTQTVVFVMLNPSRANDVEDDQTMKRVLGDFSAGFRRVEVVNLFPKRTPHTHELEGALGEVDDLNVGAIADAFSRADALVLAWGGQQGALATSINLAKAWLLPLIDEFGLEATCFGVTKNGEPRHPSRLRADAKRVPYPR